MSKQSLIDFSATRRGLKCTHEGVVRVATHLIARRDGIVWGEADWTDSEATHGVHLVSGEVKGSGPWRISGRVFEEITEQDDWEIFGAFEFIWTREKKEKRDYSEECRAMLRYFD